LLISKNALLQKSWFLTVAFKTLTLHKRHTWGMVRSLVTVLLQTFSGFRQWNEFENRSIFDEVKTYEVKACKKMSVFWATLYVNLQTKRYTL